jgi:hypothetical protein
VTNTSRITIPAGKAGYYLIQAIGQFNTTSTTGSRIVQVLKNGAAMLSYGQLGQGTATVNAVLTSNVYYLAVADYVEVYVSQNTGGAVNFDATSNLGYFSVAFLGA